MPRFARHETVSLRSTMKRPHDVRMRLRTVLLDFIKIGCKLVKHANTMVLKVSRCFSYFDALRRVEAIC